MVIETQKHRSLARSASTLYDPKPRPRRMSRSLSTSSFSQKDSSDSASQGSKASGKSPWRHPGVAPPPRKLSGVRSRKVIQESSNDAILAAMGGSKGKPTFSTIPVAPLITSKDTEEQVGTTNISVSHTIQNKNLSLKKDSPTKKQSLNKTVFKPVTKEDKEKMIQEKVAKTQQAINTITNVESKSQDRSPEVCNELTPESKSKDPVCTLRALELQNRLHELDQYELKLRTWESDLLKREAVLQQKMKQISLHSMQNILPSVAGSSSKAAVPATASVPQEKAKVVDEIFGSPSPLTVLRPKTPIVQTPVPKEIKVTADSKQHADEYVKTVGAAHLEQLAEAARQEAEATFQKQKSASDLLKQIMASRDNSPSKLSSPRRQRVRVDTDVTLSPNAWSVFGGCQKGVHSPGSISVVSSPTSVIDRCQSLHQLQELENEAVSKKISFIQSNSQHSSPLVQPQQQPASSSSNQPNVQANVPVKKEASLTFRDVIHEEIRKCKSDTSSIDTTFFENQNAVADEEDICDTFFGMCESICQEGSGTTTLNEHNRATNPMVECVRVAPVKRSMSTNDRLVTSSSVQAMRHVQSNKDVPLPKPLPTSQNRFPIFSAVPNLKPIPKVITAPAQGMNACAPRMISTPPVFSHPPPANITLTPERIVGVGISRSHIPQPVAKVSPAYGVMRTASAKSLDMPPINLPTKIIDTTQQQKDVRGRSVTTTVPTLRTTSRSLTPPSHASDNAVSAASINPVLKSPVPGIHLPSPAMSARQMTPGRQSPATFRPPPRVLPSSASNSARGPSPMPVSRVIRTLPTYQHHTKTFFKKSRQ